MKRIKSLILILPLIQMGICNAQTVESNNKPQPKQILLKISKAIGFNQIGKSVKNYKYRIVEQDCQTTVVFKYPDVYYRTDTLIKNRSLVNQNLYIENLNLSNNVFFRLIDESVKRKTLVKNVGSDGEGNWEEEKDYNSNKPLSEHALDFFVKDFFGTRNFFTSTNRADKYEILEDEIIDNKSIGVLQIESVYYENNSENVDDYVVYYDKITYLPVKISCTYKGNGTTWKKIDYSYSDYKLVSSLFLPTNLNSSIALFKYTSESYLGDVIISNISVNDSINIEDFGITPKNCLQIGLYYYKLNSFQKALDWFHKAADQNKKKNGFVYACQANIAYCYQVGKGVQQNNELAFNYHLKASDEGKGMQDSMLEIAKAYENGIGVSKNIPLAIEWYQKVLSSEKNHLNEDEIKLMKRKIKKLK